MNRHPRNPILTRADIPAVSQRISDVSAVFNPGAFKLGERYRLALRVQTRGRETAIMMADSDDGVRFTVRPRLLQVAGLEASGLRIHHVYDLRFTAIDAAIHATFAVDTDAGCRVGVARLHDDDRLELVGLDGELDARNAVLFPEKIGGRYLRLERPNDVALEAGVVSGGAIRLAESDDLTTWRPGPPLMEGRPHYWDELIGSGPPPLKTREGWLHVYHGVARHFAASNIYQAGVCLLDLTDPSRLLARGCNNVLEPREPYELMGQVPNVVFPTGLVAERHDGDGFVAMDSPLKLYYGAADTCVGLAETTVGSLLDACRVP